MNYRDEAPDIIKGFLVYHETIKGHSRATVDEYYLDLRNFFRFLKIERNIVPRSTSLEDVSIKDIDLDFVKTVTLTEFYDYLAFLSRDKIKNERSHDPKYGLTASSRARKVSTVRSFYKYLNVKAKLIDTNPLLDIDSPKVPKTLPRYLTLPEAEQLLSSVDGKNKERDYCILCIFLNCGLRISEIVGMDIQDIRQDHLRVFGKGSKERVVYINDAVASALNDYLAVRRNVSAIDKNALFLSNRRERISRETVHAMVKKSLARAGLDADKYSAHKLRHTAATLMLQNGVDVRTLQELLGHENLNTTQIYTHIDNTELRIAADANPLGSFKPKESAAPLPSQDDPEK
jgi:site-specific recombinase XerD